jgi:predicted DNA-binding transcriptional regulator AlpA
LSFIDADGGNEVQPDREDDPLIDTEKVKEMLGVEKVDTVHLYLKRTRARIKDNKPVRPQDMPLPDELFGGRAPAWRMSTITAWISRRPGRGRRGPAK